MPFQPGHKLAKGGPRRNAGRKTDAVKALARAAIGEDATPYIDAIKEIAADPEAGHKVRLAALVYLTDRALGKPRQSVALEDSRSMPTSIVMQIVGPRRPE
jgi:hypothetical protein